MIEPEFTEWGSARTGIRPYALARIWPPSPPIPRNSWPITREASAKRLMNDSISPVIISDNNWQIRGHPSLNVPRLLNHYAKSTAHLTDRPKAGRLNIDNQHWRYKRWMFRESCIRRL